MAIRLDDEARRYLALFESVTGVSGRDCVVLEDDGRETDGDRETDDEQRRASDGSRETDERTRRVLIVVSSEEMAAAIGPEGRTVRTFESRIDATVRLIEDADDPETFVANALAPAAVYNVTISENDDTVAYVEVAEADRGLAIGSDGENIDAARTLAARHHGIDDVQLT